MWRVFCLSEQRVPWRLQVWKAPYSQGPSPLNAQVCPSYLPSEAASGNHQLGLRDKQNYSHTYVIGK